MARDQKSQEHNNMWIKFVPPEKGKKIIELGKKRGPGDPVYNDFENLRIALNNLKDSIIDSIPVCITNLCKLIRL